ncbi:hypothetical protein BDV96DRAFT_650360 [Lophiotrema nucula]|uniref:F-box domain-containing protein n=1 Tax=Lophiotrema nucula TaxID=690887 RepID=A0A6A5YXD8_9PLEO|nr:hypothetical protein BDV96DRAFT_650360 [Lophiotrema nucula]
MSGTSDRRVANGKNLNDLPDELILGFFHALADISRDRVRDEARVSVFWPVCLVNRRFNAIATPFLYASLSVSRRLLRTLKDRVDLLANVQRCSFLHHRHIFLRRFSRALIKVAIEDLGVSWPAALLGPMSYQEQSENDYWGIAAILCCTPKVRCILLHFDDIDSRVHFAAGELISITLAPVISAALRRGMGTVHNFQHLQEIKINMHNIPVEKVSSLFRLPSLRSVKLWGLHQSAPSTTDHDLLWDCPPSTSFVERLWLWQADLPSSIVAKAIGCCKDLRDFVHFEGEDQTREWYQDLLVSLLVHIDSLRNLRLGEWTSKYEGEPLWDLRKLRVLERLDIPVRMVLGVGGARNIDIDHILGFGSVLPSSIKKLDLLFWGDAPAQKVTSAFQEPVSQGSPLPHLKSMKVIYKIFCDPFNGNWVWELPLEFVAYQRNCIEKDIAFDYQFKHYYMDDDDDAVKKTGAVMLNHPDGREFIRHAPEYGGLLGEYAVNADVEEDEWMNGSLSD